MSFSEDRETDLNSQSQGLQNALLRLTSPQFDSLQQELKILHQEIDDLSALQTILIKLEERLSESDARSDQQDETLQAMIDEIQTNLNKLESRLFEHDQSIRKALTSQGEQVDEQLNKLHQDIGDPEQIAHRITPLFLPLVSETVKTKQDEFAEAVSPVIGPAIRHQIRAAKDDIIDALYPLIGQIIGKAISEAFREMTRNIDARLRQQLNLRAQLDRWIARLKGVSEAELVMRDALPFSVEHVFLIQRESGILLYRLSPGQENVDDFDLISGMLTAIRDFVQDSFGDREGELEEIAHGDQRILLEGGQYAYLAIVIKGIEPSGYNQIVRETISEINVEYEEELRGFDGEMDELPDFQVSLTPLINST